MEYVKEKIFYHIQRPNVNVVFWNKGETFFVGDRKNHFISYYDVTRYGILNPANGKFYPLNSIPELSKIQVARDELSNVFDFSSENIIERLSSCLTEYLIFIREMVFEEVRKKSFPPLDSLFADGKPMESIICSNRSGGFRSFTTN